MRVTLVGRAVLLSAPPTLLKMSQSFLKMKDRGKKEKTGYPSKAIF